MVFLSMDDERRDRRKKTQSVPSPTHPLPVRVRLQAGRHEKGVRAFGPGREEREGGGERKERLPFFVGRRLRWDAHAFMQLRRHMPWPAGDEGRPIQRPSPPADSRCAVAPLPPLSHDWSQRQHARGARQHARVREGRGGGGRREGGKTRRSLSATDPRKNARAREKKQVFSFFPPTDPASLPSQTHAQARGRARLHRRIRRRHEPRVGLGPLHRGAAAAADDSATDGVAGCGGRRQVRWRRMGERRRVPRGAQGRPTRLPSWSTRLPFFFSFLSSPPARHHIDPASFTDAFDFLCALWEDRTRDEASVHVASLRGVPSRAPDQN